MYAVQVERESAVAHAVRLCEQVTDGQSCPLWCNRFVDDRYLQVLSDKGIIGWLARVLRKKSERR